MDARNLLYPSLIVMMFLPAPAWSQDVPAMANLAAPRRYEAPEISVDIQDRNLSLDGLQIGTWEDPTQPLDLAAIDGVKPPCRSIEADGVGQSFALVCPDDAGDDRLILVVQGVVLRLPHPLVPGSRIGLSDDGARVVAVFTGEEGPLLTVLDFHRTRHFTLHGLTDPSEPSIAGPGTAVACTATVDGQPRAIVVDLEFALGRILSEGLDLLETVTLSANGRRVVYRAEDHGLPNYYLVDVDRRRRFNVTSGQTDGSATAADLAQHGDTMVFVSRFGGAQGLFVADVNARKVLNVCGFFQPLGDAQISATGTRIAFLKGGVSEEVAVWDTEGKGALEVTTVVGDFASMALTSDGRVLALLTHTSSAPASLLELHPLPPRE